MFLSFFLGGGQKNLCKEFSLCLGPVWSRTSHQCHLLPYLLYINKKRDAIEIIKHV